MGGLLGVSIYADLLQMFVNEWAAEDMSDQAVRRRERPPELRLAPLPRWGDRPPQPACSVLLPRRRRRPYQIPGAPPLGVNQVVQCVFFED